MDEREKKIKRELINVRKSIMKKYRSLHTEKLTLEEKNRERYEPIVQPLTQLLQEKEILNISKYEGGKTEVDANAGYDEEEESEEEDVDKKEEIHMDTGLAENYPAKTSDASLSTETYHEYNLNPVVRLERLPKNRYSNKLKLNESTLERYYNLLHTNKSDQRFGVRIDKKSNTLKIGNSDFFININEQKIVVDSHEFTATQGLLDLLFYNNPPKTYDSVDLEEYKKILLLTETHKKYFESEHPLKKNQSLKYQKIVQPLFGSGMKNTYKVEASQKIDLVYWDDPNELIERLRLLNSSRMAGHSNHRNEIISIIEELKEANLIQ